MTMEYPGFLAALAAPHPIPGGGAAAAYGAVVGLCLLRKALQVEGRRKGAGALWAALLKSVLRLETIFLRLLEDDGKAYARWAAARSSGQTAGAVQGALEEAVACPSRMIDAAVEGLALAARVAKECRGHLLGDVQVTGCLLEGAARGAFCIARANLDLSQDLPWREKALVVLERSARSAAEAAWVLQCAVQARSAGR